VPAVRKSLTLPISRRHRAEGKTESVQWCLPEVTVKVADWVAPLYVPEIVTLVFCDTLVVLTVKVALVLPAAMVTLEGTVATDVFPLVSVTTAPPEGALPLRVTVPVELLPPLTLVGFRVNEERLTLEAGKMVREACAELDPSVPVITAVVFVVTDVVVTVKEALVLPAATVTLPSTLADALLLESVTTEPPGGAPAVRLTVPVEVFPPVTSIGFRINWERLTLEAGVMVREACAELDPSVAVVTAVVVVVTDVVVTVKEALVLPAATVTLLGTLADPLLLESDTTEPPEGAFAVRTTVPVKLFPPVTVETRSTEETLGTQELPGFTVKLLETLTPPDSAKIGTTSLVLVHKVPSEKLRLVLPAGTVTVTGSCPGGLGSAGLQLAQNSIKT
jgi:hypothetical protein